VDGFVAPRPFAASHCFVSLHEYLEQLHEGFEQQKGADLVWQISMRRQAGNQGLRPIFAD
jgi:hypothetical protein